MISHADQQGPLGQIPNTCCETGRKMLIACSIHAEESLGSWTWKANAYDMHTEESLWLCEEWEDYAGVD